MPRLLELRADGADEFDDYELEDGLRKRAVTESSELDPQNDQCEFAFHQTTLYDGKLWTLGGYVGWSNGTEFVGPNQFLRVVDMTQSFKLSDRDAPIQYLVQAKDVPETSAGTLWNYDGMIYSVGGEFETASSNMNWTDVNEPNPWSAQWTYDTTSASSAGSGWKAGDMVDDSGNELLRYVHQFSAQVNGKGYLLGGWIRTEGVTESDNTNSSMTIYDFENDSWKNYTTPFKQAHMGKMVHVPIGDKGIMVLISGWMSNHDESSYIQDINMLNLNEDGKNGEGEWATVQSTVAADVNDAIPASRQHACAVSVSAPDNSSHQIFVYGGSSSGSKEQYGDLWVLSIPSFEWFKVEQNTGSMNPGKREGHTCEVVGGNIMVVYGGRVLPNFSRTCETTDLYAFNMTSMKWLESYDSDALNQNYTLNKQLYNWIGGDANGGASKLPAEGIADKNIKALVAAQLSAASATASVAPAAEPTDYSAVSSASSTASSSSGTSTGGIVGGVVGGVAGLALIVGAAFFWWRRRRQTKQTQYQGPLDAETHDEAAASRKLPIPADTENQPHYYSPEVKQPIVPQQQVYEMESRGQFHELESDSPVAREMDAPSHGAAKK